VHSLRFRIGGVPNASECISFPKTLARWPIRVLESGVRCWKSLSMTEEGCGDLDRLSLSSEGVTFGVRRLWITRALPSSTCDHPRHLLTTTVRVRVSPSAAHPPLFSSNLCGTIVRRMDTLVIILGPATTTSLTLTKLIFLSIAILWITSGILIVLYSATIPLSPRTYRRGRRMKMVAVELGL
jgi:hypothetical protein